MLCELRVENFAIIDNIQISFRKGLNIVSGETGAGKSVLLRSLSLLMGEKASPDWIRTGSDTARIQGQFSLVDRPDVVRRLRDLDIECDDDQMVVRRIVARQAHRSRVHINGQLATLSALRDVVAPLVEVSGRAVPLIEMTGQHDNRNLLSTAYHLESIDIFGGTIGLRERFEEHYARWLDLQREYTHLLSSERERALEIDFLCYQRDEIRQIGLSPGDEEFLERETKRVRSASRLIEFAQSAFESLDGGDSDIVSRLDAFIRRGSELSSLDPSLETLLAPLPDIRATLCDVAQSLNNYAASLDADPERLTELENQLQRLRSLQRKYGTSIEEILATSERLDAQIAALLGADERAQSLASEIADLRVILDQIGGELSEKRKSAAKRFGKSVCEELSDLNMKGVVFEVRLKRESEPGAQGFDHIEFLSRSSKSDEARPIAKVSSGGELSRILLSVKRVIGKGAPSQTLLFDEVDAGVSGETADRVGRKLKTISKDNQVLCVTHLPQVACFGDAHLSIEKVTTGDTAEMRVKDLSGRKDRSQRLREIARLLSGEHVSPTSLAHAEALLEEATLV